MPKQKNLPGMEDAKLEKLHELADEYVDVRDKRMALNAEEKPIKEALLKLMKTHKKTHYQYNGLTIDVIHENEKVRVKLHKDAEEESFG